MKLFRGYSQMQSHAKAEERQIDTLAENHENIFSLKIKNTAANIQSPAHK